jgi:predicted permease
MAPQDARTAALRAFGGLAQRKEECRDMRGVSLIQNLMRDVRYGARTLRGSPVFTAVAILSLALGIGATSAIFSAADALLLRPLPVPRANEVVTIAGSSPDGRIDFSVSYPDYIDLRDRSTSFHGLAAFTYLRLGMADKPNALPQVQQAAAVSDNFFRTLEVQPALGRSFSPEENDVFGRNAVAILSFDEWTRRFSRDPKILGRTIRLNDIEFSIVGVAPETFPGPDMVIHPEVYIPIMMLPRVGNWAASAIGQRDARWFTVKGRLKPGVGLAAAAVELATLARRLSEAYPNTNRNQGLIVRTELQARAEQAPPRVALSAMLLAIAVLVLMVACANVASLLLGRASARAREMAVRLAVGASPARLVQQLFTEGLILALSGGAFGLLIAGLGIGYLSSVVSSSSDLQPVYLSFRLDQRVLWFSLIAAVMSALMFGLAPAVRAARIDLVPALKAGATNPSHVRAWGRSTLVVGQVTLTLMLLCAAALFVRTFQAIAFANPGFRTDHLAMMSFDPTLTRHTPEQTAEFYRTLVESARQLTGINHAALAQMAPTEYIPPSARIAPEGFQFPRGRDSDSALTYTVSDQYFETIGTPLLGGRGFLPTDTATSPRVAVINQVFAETYWPNLDPIGKRFRLGGPTGAWVEVVGVAKTTWYTYVGEDRVPFFYRALAQNPQAGMTLMVETSTTDAAGLVGPLRSVVSSIDASQPVFNVRTMQEYYRQHSLQTLRLVAQLVGTMECGGPHFLDKKDPLP